MKNWRFYSRGYETQPQAGLQRIAKRKQGYGEGYVAELLSHPEQLHGVLGNAKLALLC